MDVLGFIFIGLAIVFAWWAAGLLIRVETALSIYLKEHGEDK